MTTMKLGMMGAALATSLVGGAAHAEGRYVAAPPARVEVRAPRVMVAPVRVASRGRDGWDRDHDRRWDRDHDRRVVVSPPPRYYPGYNYGSTVTVYGGYDTTASFEAQIRAEMNQADADLRYDVQQGAVRPDALSALAADRQEIERDLAESCQKGYVTADDRAHLEAHVQEIRNLRDQYGVQTAAWYR